MDNLEASSDADSRQPQSAMRRRAWSQPVVILSEVGAGTFSGGVITGDGNTPGGNTAFS